jgi:hypothetical protein
MSNDRALAAEYRKHAQELRHVADEQRPVWANVALRKAADDYDGMAESLERICAACDATSEPLASPAVG